MQSSSYWSSDPPHFVKAFFYNLWLNLNQVLANGKYLQNSFNSSHILLKLDTIATVATLLKHKRQLQHVLNN